jgi:hypothetical protein
MTANSKTEWLSHGCSPPCASAIQKTRHLDFPSQETNRSNGFSESIEVSNINFLLAQSKLHNRLTVGFFFVAALSYDLGLLVALAVLR